MDHVGFREISPKLSFSTTELNWNGNESLLEGVKRRSYRDEDAWTPWIIIYGGAQSQRFNSRNCLEQMPVSGSLIIRLADSRIGLYLKIVWTRNYKRSLDGSPLNSSAVDLVSFLRLRSRGSVSLLRSWACNFRRGFYGLHVTLILRLPILLWFLHHLLDEPSPFPEGKNRKTTELREGNPENNNLILNT